MDMDSVSALERQAGLSDSRSSEGEKVKTPPWF